MRTLTNHRTGYLNEHLEITASEVLTPGGAPLSYIIHARPKDPAKTSTLAVELTFQNGPPDQQINGISMEALLAVIIDRLRCFQGIPVEGVPPGPRPFANRDNDVALMHIEAGLGFLQNRTRERISRGVEGKLLK